MSITKTRMINDGEVGGRHRRPPLVKEHHMFYIYNILLLLSCTIVPYLRVARGSDQFHVQESKLNHDPVLLFQTLKYLEMFKLIILPSPCESVSMNYDNCFV